MMPAGLVKLMSQASGAVDLPADIQDHGNGAQGLGVAARTGSLLANHIVFQRDGLILGAGVQTAHPELGDDKVGAADGLLEVMPAWGIVTRKR